MQKFVIEEKQKAFFTCQKCFQFSQNPQECKNCKLVTCFECIKLQSKYYCLNFNFRGCSCIDVPRNLDKLTQSIYDKFQSRCENCEEFLDNKCLRKEQYSYQYFSNKERLNNLKIYPNKTFTKLKCKICLKIPFQPVQNKFLNYYGCNQCMYKNYSDFIHLDENSIQLFYNLVLQCKSCQLKGNFFEMQNHKMECTEEKVSCKCSWIGYQSLFKDHLIQCISNEISKEAIILNKQIITQRLITSNCYISKAIYVKQRSKQIKFIKEFELQQYYPNFEASSRENSQSEQFFNVYDFQENFDSH